MLTDAVAPVDTRPIDSEVAGAVWPVTPCGIKKSSLAAYAVPTLTTLATDVGETVFVDPTSTVAAAPGWPPTLFRTDTLTVSPFPTALFTVVPPTTTTLISLMGSSPLSTR
jgi:hypothetical protein